MAITPVVAMWYKNEKRSSLFLVDISTQTGPNQSHLQVSLWIVHWPLLVVSQSTYSVWVAVATAGPPHSLHSSLERMDPSHWLPLGYYSCLVEHTISVNGR